jgi:transcriptional regulator with XRE-family HTH domain
MNEALAQTVSMNNTRKGRKKKKASDVSGFGSRLVALRKATGFTQLELAQELCVSRRVIAYYEGETQHPPTTMLPRLAQALGVSADELLNGNGRREAPASMSVRMRRKLQQLEQLGAKERRQAMQLLDMFIEREALKRQA